MIRYTFKTRAVEDCRPLVDMAGIGMPWWCSGIAGDGSYATMVCYLPEVLSLHHYWDDAYDIMCERVREIKYSRRFPKPAWLS